MSDGLIVRCPGCSARLRLQPGRELPDRFKVRCSSCGKPFLVRRREESSRTTSSVPPLDRTLIGEQVATGVTPVRPGDAASLHGQASPTIAGGVLPESSMFRSDGRSGTFVPGEMVSGRYRIERFIAKGGMGEVYEAFDSALGEPVALKTVRPDVAADELALDRFKREIQLARQVTHRNVCRIHDLGTHRTDSAVGSFYPRKEILFVTMELLRGESLADHLQRRGALSEEETLPLVRQMVAALEAAHAAGIVHRDFKCANVVLEPTEGGARAVVTDFGLARGRQGVDHGTLTVAGAVMGSPAYMAPEQVEGGKITPAVDVYALGVVLFELLTGKLPFKGESPLTTAIKRLTEAPPRPSEVRPGLGSRWEEVILRCLARNPEDRYASAADVLAALDPTPLAAALGTARVTRKRLWQAVAAGFLVAVALALGLSTWRSRMSDEGPRLAVPTVARPAVAVLGLRNVTGDEDLEWLSSGLPEMLASELSSGDAVRLIPGENVSRVQRELGLEPGATWGNDTLERVRRNLGSDYIVTGGYTALGGEAGQLRLDLRLQDTLTAGNSTAVAVTGSRDALFDLVAEAGVRLREALQLSGGGGSWKERNPEAVRLYAQGLEKLRGFDALAARSLLEQAVALDPRDPRSHAALASALGSLGYQEKARAAAQQAVELSAGLSEEERQEIRAQYLEMAGDPRAAARAWEELWNRYPDNLEYGLELAQQLTAAGEANRALEVVVVLRRLPSAAAGDLRIHFVEAEAAGALGDFRRQQESAHRAAELALAQGARLQRAPALLLEGWALRNLTQMERAQGVTSEAEGLFQQAGDSAGVARARVQRASLLYDQGDLAMARRVFSQALATYRQLGDKGGEAQALNNLALVLKQQGELGPALALYEQSRQLCSETGNRVGLANTEINAGTIRLKRGDLAGAQAAFQSALEVSRSIGDQSLEAYALYNLAATQRRLGQLAAADAGHRAALELRRKIGQRIGEVASLTELAGLQWDRGDLATATSSYEQALELARETGNRRFEAYALAGLGQVRLDAGDLAAAEKLHREALALREDLGELGTAAESRLALAVVALEAARFEESEALARAAEERLTGEGALDLLAFSRAVRARSLVFLGRGGEAQRLVALAGARAAASEDLRLRCEVKLSQARVAATLDRNAEATRLATEAAAAAAAAGLLAVQLEARLLLGQLARENGEEARGAQLVAEVRTRAQQSGLGLLSRKAGG